MSRLRIVHKSSDSGLRQPDLEEQLMSTHASLLKKNRKIYNFHVCCCCKSLNQRKSISVVAMSDNVNSDVWPDLQCNIFKEGQYVPRKHCSLKFETSFELHTNLIDLALQTMVFTLLLSWRAIIVG